MKDIRYPVLPPCPIDWNSQRHSHEIHDYYLILHPAARQFKKDQHAARQQKVARLADTGSSSVQPSGGGPANPRKPPAPTKSLSLETVNFQDPEVRHACSLPCTVDIKHRISQLSSHFPIAPKVTPHIFHLRAVVLPLNSVLSRICIHAFGTCKLATALLLLFVFHFALPAFVRSSNIPLKTASTSYSLTFIKHVIDTQPHTYPCLSILSS